MIQTSVHVPENQSLLAAARRASQCRQHKEVSARSMPDGEHLAVMWVASTYMASISVAQEVKWCWFILSLCGLAASAALFQPAALGGFA